MSDWKILCPLHTIVLTNLIIDFADFRICDNFCSAQTQNFKLLIAKNRNRNLLKPFRKIYQRKYEIEFGKSVADFRDLLAKRHHFLENKKQLRLRLKHDLVLALLYFYANNIKRRSRKKHGFFLELYIQDFLLQHFLHALHNFLLVLVLLEI